MKDLTLGTLLAVFEEMFGAGLFWLMVAAAVLITIGYVFVLVRDKSVSMKKFLWAQVSMPFAAVLAIAFVLWATDSQITDIGGPIDVVVFLGIAAMGAVGGSILVYTLQSLFWRPQ